LQKFSGGKLPDLHSKGKAEKGGREGEIGKEEGIGWEVREGACPK
jgi:hypothetical protein